MAKSQRGSGHHTAGQPMQQRLARACDDHFMHHRILEQGRGRDPARARCQRGQCQAGPAPFDQAQPRHAGRGRVPQRQVRQWLGPQRPDQGCDKGPNKGHCRRMISHEACQRRQIVEWGARCHLGQRRAHYRHLRQGPPRRQRGIAASGLRSALAPQPRHIGMNLHRAALPVPAQNSEGASGGMIS